MSYSDSTLMAFVDGELDATTSREIERALAQGANPDLAERVARQRHLREALQEAYAPVLDEPIPPGLRQTLAQAPSPSPASPPRPSQWRERLRAWMQALKAPQALAMAACAVFGMAVGVGLRAPVGVFDSVDGRLLARGALAQALDERLAEDPVASDGVRLGVSFASRHGRYCRSFMLAGAGRVSGLACRGDQGWQVDVLAAQSNSAASAPAGESYRQAGSETAPEVLRAIDERIDGAALDAAGERQARERGWRR